MAVLILTGRLFLLDYFTFYALGDLNPQQVEYQRVFEDLLSYVSFVVARSHLQFVRNLAQALSHQD